jgi:hypothetical protein
MHAPPPVPGQAFRLSRQAMSLHEGVQEFLVQGHGLAIAAPGVSQFIGQGVTIPGALGQNTTKCQLRPQGESQPLPVGWGQGLPGWTGARSRMPDDGVGSWGSWGMGA